MKRNIILFFLLLFCFSCSWEEELSTGNGGPDPNITRGFISLQVTGEHTENDSLSDDIKTIRFIVFTGLYAYPKVEVNEYKTIPISEAGRVSAMKGVFELTIADKLVVAIANEPASMTEALNAVTTPRELEDLDLMLSDFLMSDHLSLQPGSMMPMSGAVWTNKNDMHTTQAAAEAASGHIQLLLQRAVARVDVYLTTDITGGVELLPGSRLTLKNTYTESYFVHHKSGTHVLGKIQTVASAGFAGNDKSWTLAVGQQNIPVPEKGTKPEKPESEFAHVCTFYTPERNCITDKLIVDISLKTDDGDKNATITLDYMYNEAGDRLPIEVVKRNNRYIVRGNIRKANLEAGVVVLPWNEGLEPFPLGQYYLRVDKSLLEFPSAGGTQVVAVATNHPDSWKIDKTGNLPTGVTARKAEDNTVEIEADPKIAGTLATSGWFTVRAGNLSKIVHVTQEAPPVPPVLEHAGNNLPTVIPQAGGTYTVWAKTNLAAWGVKIYAGANNTGTLVNTVANVAGSTDINVTGTYQATVTVGTNGENTPRKFSFYLYSDNYNDTPAEIYVGTRSQEAELTLPNTGFPAPPGVLGVTASGELTLRGSNLYKGTKVAADSEFGPVHEEAVFVAYFRWGSLVSINSTSNAANPNALISNGDEFEFTDFDWIHPDYTYNGLKGAKALYAQLGSGKTPAQMWNTLPMNGGLANWSPTNTAAGTGDPCPYATVDANGTLAAGYHVPGGNNNGWNGMNTSQLENRLVTDNVKLTNNLIVYGYRDKDVGAQGWGMFLPYVGNRQTSGRVSGRGYDGTYWSGTLAGGAGSYLTLGSGSVGIGTNPNTMGMTIRCVK
ncbi:MAG: hypothetical protein LBV47_02780 [Bacteroidales bacterium]|jgi:hypothetical protein|nr:hypothetical protein [Bacteroidales bacterium]